MTTQRVWRTMSEIKIAGYGIGYFVWEVTETVGEITFVHQEFKELLNILVVKSHMMNGLIGTSNDN